MGFAPADDTTRAGGGVAGFGFSGVLVATPSASGSEFFLPGGGFLVETTGLASASAAASDGPSEASGSRTRPSRSAFRRTRSAWASTMLEEWLLTPIPRSLQRSMTSLFERPISRASS